MKRFKIASAFLAGAMLFSATSCEKFFEDDVVSPNDPESSTASLLMANIEVATFATFGGQLARQSEVMVQRLAGTSAGSQTVEIANYVITDQTNQNEWDVIYTGVMANSRIMLRDYGASSPWYAGITKVLMAMNIGLATDLWGDVPFAEAGFGDNLEPAFESQQSIYSGIQSLLDEAIADLSSPEASNTFLPTTDDFIYNGDVMMWIQTARVLKARYANHLSKRDPAGSAAAALAAISAGGMTSSGDNCNMVFFNSGNSLNQWFCLRRTKRWIYPCKCHPFGCYGCKVRSKSKCTFWTRCLLWILWDSLRSSGFNKFFLYRIFVCISSLSSSIGNLCRATVY